MSATKVLAGRAKPALVVAAALAATLVATSDCTLLVKSSATQCSSDGDCAAFTGTYCSPDKVCVSNLLFCKTNTECQARNTPTFICDKAKHACVDVLATHCPKIFSSSPADLANDDVIVFGSLLSPSTSVAPETSVDVARQDFHDAVGGVPQPNGPPRPVVVVACDVDQNKTDEMIAATKHLIDDVKVPAIIGPLNSADALTLLSQVTIPSGTLLVSSSASADFLFTQTGEHGLFYSFSARQAVITDAHVKLVASYVEPLLRQRLGITATTPIKVAIAFSDNPNGKSASDSLIANLVVNGQSFAANVANNDGFATTYGDPGAGDYTTRLAAAAAAIVNFAPQLVLVVGAKEQLDLLKALVQAESSTFHPMYEGNSALTGSDFSFVTPDLRTRLLWVAPGPSAASPLLASYKAHYAALHPDSASLAGAFSGAATDASYMLLYATGRTLFAGKPLTGLNIGEAFQELEAPKTTPVPWGSDHVADAFKALAAGQTFDYVGVTSPCDFDASGSTEVDQIVYCVDPALTPKAHPRESGLIRSAATHDLVGTNTCF